MDHINNSLNFANVKQDEENYIDENQRIIINLILDSEDVNDNEGGDDSGDGDGNIIIL